MRWVHPLIPGGILINTVSPARAAATMTSLPSGPTIRPSPLGTAKAPAPNDGRSAERILAARDDRRAGHRGTGVRARHADGFPAAHARRTRKQRARSRRWAALVAEPGD